MVSPIALRLLKGNVKDALAHCVLRVAVTTCIGSGHETLGGCRWDNVVMDECTQSVWPSTLAPLIGFLNRKAMAEASRPFTFIDYMVQGALDVMLSPSSCRSLLRRR